MTAPGGGDAPSPAHPPTPVSIFLNLFIAAAGAGLLSYPFAVHQQGMVLCALLTLVFAAVNLVTDLILVQSAALFRGSPLLGGLRSYEALVAASLGPRLAAIAGATVIIGSLGALIGYLIIVGDSVCGPLAVALGCDGGGGGGGAASDGSGGAGTTAAGSGSCAGGGGKDEADAETRAVDEDCWE